jgi:hypothetical protein
MFAQGTLERVNFKRMDDYVLNYEELLEKSKMPLLKVRRLRSIAIETFKIIHKESPIYLHDLVNK